MLVELITIIFAISALFLFGITMFMFFGDSDADIRAGMFLMFASITLCIIFGIAALEAHGYEIDIIKMTPTK